MPAAMRSARLCDTAAVGVLCWMRCAGHQAARGAGECDARLAVGVGRRGRLGV